MRALALLILVLYVTVCVTTVSSKETENDTIGKLNSMLMLFQERLSHLENSLQRERELNVEFRENILEKNTKLQDRVLKLEIELRREKEITYELTKHRGGKRGLTFDVKQFRKVNDSFDFTDDDGGSEEDYRRVDGNGSDKENSKGSFRNAKRLLLPTTSPTAKEAHVAFYAYMSKTEVNPGPHHILVFDVVKTNIGNCYRPTSGTFIAPTSGLYVFTWSIRQLGGDYHSTELIINNAVYGSQYLYAKDSDASVSQTLVAYLNQGEDVFVRTHSTFSPHGDIRSNGNGRSTFSGWRIN